MHTFKVVKQPYGWAVRMNHGMSTPFWSRASAIQEANCLCSTIRSHGEATEVVIEEIDFADIPVDPSGSAPATDCAAEIQAASSPIIAVCDG